MHKVNEIDDYPMTNREKRKNKEYYGSYRFFTSMRLWKERRELEREEDGTQT